MILGMDWLHSFYASLDYWTRKVIFRFPNKPKIEWEGCPLAPRKDLYLY